MKSADAVFCSLQTTSRREWGSVCVRRHSDQDQFPFSTGEFPFRKKEKTWWRPDQASVSNFSSNSGDCTWYFTQATSVSSFSSVSLDPLVFTHFWVTGSDSFQVNSFSFSRPQFMHTGNFYKVLVDRDHDQFVWECLSSTGLVVAISVIKYGECRTWLVQIKHSLRSGKNFLARRLMVLWRRSLTSHMQRLYIHGHNFYKVSNQTIATSHLLLASCARGEARLTIRTRDWQRMWTACWPPMNDWWRMTSSYFQQPQHTTLTRYSLNFLSTPKIHPCRRTVRLLGSVRPACLDSSFCLSSTNSSWTLSPRGRQSLKKGNNGHRFDLTSLTPGKETSATYTQIFGSMQNRLHCRLEKDTSFVAFLSISFAWKIWGVFLMNAILTSTTRMKQKRFLNEVNRA